MIGFWFSDYLLNFQEASRKSLTFHYKLHISDLNTSPTRIHNPQIYVSCQELFPSIIFLTSIPFNWRRRRMWYREWTHNRKLIILLKCDWGHFSAHFIFIFFLLVICIFFYCLALHCIKVLQFVYPFTSWWMFGLFPVWGNLDKAATNIHSQDFVWTYIFTSLRFYGNLFNFLWNGIVNLTTVW